MKQQLFKKVEIEIQQEEQGILQENHKKLNEEKRDIKPQVSKLRLLWIYLKLAVLFIMKCFLYFCICTLTTIGLISLIHSDIRMILLEFFDYLLQVFT